MGYVHPIKPHISWQSRKSKLKTKPTYSHKYSKNRKQVQFSIDITVKSQNSQANIVFQY